MIELFLKLLLAHIIGDFVFQPNKWVKDKEDKKARSKYLYAHVLVHAAALIICLLPDIRYWAGALAILLAHYLIDVAKLTLQPPSGSRILFLLDQIAHLLVIGGVVYYYTPFSVDYTAIIQPNTLLLIISVLTCTHVGGVCMKLLLARWHQEIIPPQKDSGKETMSLEDAGIYIGMLERLFVFFIVISGQLSGIGFLLAAKSVFRFGDLSNAKDRKLTEYILIGTLLSFGFAILTAQAYLYLKTLL